MTTSTVDITAKLKIKKDEPSNSILNTDIDIDAGQALAKSKNSHYYYSSGSFNFILDKSFKPETLEEKVLTPMPFLPSWHLGIISVHGHIIPVIDILGFVSTQNIVTEENKSTKTYLLKLEHKDYSPIVFKLDALPRLVNTDEFEKTEISKNSPEWVEHYLKKESTTLALIDHKKLFDQLIKKQ